MRIGFVGLGKLGLPCALAIESKGHSVCGWDESKAVRDFMSSRYGAVTPPQLPYREEGAQELLDKGRIRVNPVKFVVLDSDIIFVAVQTPHQRRFEGTTRLPQEREDFNYDYLTKAMTDIAAVCVSQGKEKIVVVISTVLPDTIDREIRPLLPDNCKLCYNPFFIAMGTTIHDFLNPEFVLLGCDDAGIAKRVEDFYATLHDRPVVVTTVKNAELIKVAYNTFIGMKIVFANTLMEICHKTGCDVDTVTDALGMATDRLISTKYMSGGMGDGGGCHPRDNIALSWLARKLDLSYDWFGALMKAREDQTEWLADLIACHLRPGDQVVLLGKAFKPETNLTVGSPATLLRNLLAERGIQAETYDPHIDGSRCFSSGLFFISTKHAVFAEWDFPEDSIVIDPWRYIPDQEGVQVIRVGDGK
jgi:UDPglucose 6-dehydrogenase